MNVTLPPAGDKLVHLQNLRTLTLRSFLFGLRMNIVRAIWQPFVLSLGASMPLLGLLESIGGLGGIVSTAMLPLGGWLSDRRGRKPFVIIASAFAVIALSTLALAGWMQKWQLLLPGVLFLGLAAIGRPAVDSMTAESVTPDARGQAFGLVTMSYAISGIFAPTLGGFLAGRCGFLTVLLAGAALELGILYLIAIALCETLPLEGQVPLRAFEFFRLLKRIITPPANLRNFYVAVTIDVFAFGTGATILAGLLTKTYHFTPFQLGIMASVSSATWAISQLFIGQQVDEHGCVPFLIASETLAVFVTGGWLVAKSFEAFVALEVLNGLIPATWMPAFMAWISNSVPEGQRAEEIGRLGAFRGFLGFPAPYVGGLLYEAVGFRGPIMANLIGAAMVILVLWLFVGEPQKA